MIKNYKQFIFGFVFGSIFFSGMTFAATEIKQATITNEINLTVNGEKKDITFANIEGTNFAKVRDIVSAMGGTTEYDSSTQTIEVKTNSEVTSMSDTNTTTTGESTFTPDGLIPEKYNGNYYIDWLQFNNKYKENGYKLSKDIKSKQWNLYKNNQVVLDNIPTTLTYGHESIEYDYYVNTIIPLLK